ncbi:hypothetical protein D3C75_1283520 [compost metagenome]
MISEFSYAYFDIVTGQSRLVDTRVLSSEFIRWVEKRSASIRPNNLNEVEAVKG